MKKISTFILATVMVMTLSQCKKNEQNTTADKGVAITLNVIDDKNDTNTRVDVNTMTGTVDFEENDQILVASGGKYVGTLTYNGNLFTGSVYNAVAGYPLRFYFLGNITPAETLTYGETETCSVVITDQTEHLPVVSYAPSNENYGTTTDFTSHLLNKCALVKFNVTSASEAATCITGFNNKVTVSFAESTLTPSQEGNGVITLPAGTGERWAILLPQAALAAGGAGSAYSADNAYTGTRGAVPAIGFNAFLTAGIPVTLEAGGGGGGGGGTIGNHEYVDLGLPSGLLWATCNVGADTPEGYGDYFAWGETQPKSTYNWSTYQYCMGSYNTMTKYCNNSSYGYNGFTDNLTVLLPEDDAATANWGSSWRMPTREEWQELYQNTTHIWTTQNGVNGRLFTASNGNSLFLPAAGYRDNGSLYLASGYGYYWSSSLYTGRSDLAWWFYFNSEDNYGMGSLNGRRDGYSVRPVYSGQPSITTYTITVSANPAEGGNVSGGGTFQSGETCTVTATANSGYTFTNWTENGSVVTTDDCYSFNVDANRTLVANFAYNGGGGGAPIGAINGLFTINNNGDQVYFSKGNLQYIGSAATPYWKFADNQWDYFGTTTGQNSSNQNVDRDLFGWGTSGYNHGAVCYQPWSTSTNYSDYYVYGNSIYNLYDQTSQADWGYNAISNGGNQENSGWRTLTNQEWYYVARGRTTSSGIISVQAIVNNIYGIILLPDNWINSTYPLNTNLSYGNNIISAADWTNVLEANGAVFLPAAGLRNVNSVGGGDDTGMYWSSTCKGNENAYDLYFITGVIGTSYNYRRYGYAVRLVRNVN